MKHFVFGLLIALAAAMAPAMSTQAVAGEPVTAIQIAKAHGDVCCQRSGRDWFTSRAQCKRLHGKIVRDLECRIDTAGEKRVCCKIGKRDRFTTRAACSRLHGRVVANRQCRVDTVGETVVCCKRGTRDGFLTLSACRKIHGTVVRDRACRID